jgi:hypothetical protein
MRSHPATHPTPEQLATVKALRGQWYRKSGIVSCDRCEGHGAYWNGRGLGGTDPESWDIDCPDCDALGHHACAVCGFDVVAPGFDCLACDMVRELPIGQLTGEVADKLAASIKAAINVAAEAECASLEMAGRAQVRRAAA